MKPHLAHIGDLIYFIWYDTNTSAKLLKSYWEAYKILFFRTFWEMYCPFSAYYYMLIYINYCFSPYDLILSLANKFQSSVHSHCTKQTVTFLNKGGISKELFSWAECKRRLGDHVTNDLDPVKMWFFPIWNFLLLFCPEKIRLTLKPFEVWLTVIPSA